MIIVDTGFWLALANRKDSNHRLAKAAFAKIGEPLITTWPVLTETCHLLVSRLGVFAELLFMKSLAENAFYVDSILTEEYVRLVVLMKKYKDLPMDLADASLVLLAERLGTGKILSTDKREFKTYRWKTRQPFENLMI